MLVTTCCRVTQAHFGGKVGHPTVANANPVTSSRDHRGTRSARAGGPLSGYLRALPGCLDPGVQGAVREASPGPRPLPASRQRAEVTHARSHFRRAETRKKLGAAEAPGRLSPLLLCPVARAAPSLREPWPWGSPGRPQCEVRGLPRAPHTGRGRAGGRQRSSRGRGRGRLCPPGLPAS